uniref:Uncharacterized protein n=1 Tax=viral metagenome TaxID=1070528 RepID=A0A6M3M8W3_9ZZZZ
MPTQHIKKRVKRILYTLYQKTNRELWEFAFGEGREGQRRALEILNRLIKKGFVGKIAYKAMDPNHACKYYLTEEGKNIAKDIAKEIDEHKSW